jgi:hypothetical protein
MEWKVENKYFPGMVLILFDDGGPEHVTKGNGFKIFRQGLIGSLGTLKIQSFEKKIQDYPTM